MPIPQKIQELANKVRSAIYGKEVRDAIAESMEETGEASEYARNLSKETQERFDEQIKNMTLEDPSSAEIIDARGGFNLLRDRLTSNDEQLAHTVRKDETFTSVRQFGALGLGVSCPVYSENPNVLSYKTYATKEEFQNAFPLLTDDYLLFRGIGEWKTLEIDWCAIQSAILFLENNLLATSNYSAGDFLYFPSGIYFINYSLIINENIPLGGENRASEIRNLSQNGDDTFIYSTEKYLFNVGISNLSIVTESKAGHGINIKYGLATSAFRDLYIFTRNPEKSCIFADQSSYGGGIYDTIFEGGEYFGERWGRTAPIVDITVNGTWFNENAFKNLRITGSTGTQAIKVKNVDTQTFLVNNRYENLNIEICAGGGLYLESAKANTLANISFWDMPTYTGDLINMGDGVGFASESNVLMNVCRHGDKLADGVVDINFTNSNDNVLINFQPTSSAQGKIDFNSRRVTVIGRILATILNDTNIIQLSALDGLQSNVVGVKGAGRLRQTNGDTILDTFINGKMFKIETKKADGTTRRIWFEPNGDSLFPIEDNSIDLGKTTNRYRNVHLSSLRLPNGVMVYSGTGTPEGRDSAPVGSMYTRTDGGVGTTLYVKESGTGNTGWVAK